ncbi:hypothetical protein Q73_10445 [Bacillus coahuilensis m2-6]|uniref:tetratricopeptide repeat protein n=1 Tax=Bacillus coahuilensis TaxID=408580 RepID=UPI00075040C4|nr:tetratricopeptide repeat protein [Bacillus coahuilensis]KUP06997.1 hypothetical protein Q73_10445 [Bacillus coahuilensis m2-6]
MKRRHLEKKGNVVYFPGMKDMLLEKGFKALEAKDYPNAVSYFQEGYSLEPTNSAAAIGFVYALYENKQYEASKEVCETLLKEGIGDYFEVMRSYLLALLQLRDHEQIVETLTALFEEREIPIEFEDQFQKILRISSKVLTKKQPTSTHSEPIRQPKSSFLVGNITELTYKLAQLVYQNIYPYKEELIYYLQTEGAHPFIQSMVLNVLREHGVEQMVKVKKLGNEGEFSPLECKDVFELSWVQNVLKEIEDVLSHSEPTTMMHVVEVVKRHAFLLYPFEAAGDTKKLAESYILYVKELLGAEVNREDQELEGYLDNIRKLENISSPNM